MRSFRKFGGRRGRLESQKASHGCTLQVPTCRRGPLGYATCDASLIVFRLSVHHGCSTARTKFTTIWSKRTISRVGHSVLADPDQGRCRFPVEAFEMVRVASKYTLQTEKIIVFLSFTSTSSPGISTVAPVRFAGAC
jgi:hypothetical protein